MYPTQNVSYLHKNKISLGMGSATAYMKENQKALYQIDKVLSKMILIFLVYRIKYF